MTPTELLRHDDLKLPLIQRGGVDFLTFLHLKFQAHRKLIAELNSDDLSNRIRRQLPVVEKLALQRI